MAKTPGGENHAVSMLQSETCPTARHEAALLGQIYREHCWPIGDRCRRSPLMHCSFSGPMRLINEAFHQGRVCRNGTNQPRNEGYIEPRPAMSQQTLKNYFITVNFRDFSRLQSYYLSFSQAMAQSIRIISFSLTITSIVHRTLTNIRDG